MIRKPTHSLFSVVALLMCALIFSGCGGGTSGTGLKSYEGTVLTREELPVQNATITLIQSGDFAITDNGGHFLLQSKVFGERVDFRIESSEISALFALQDIPEDSSTITMKLTIDPSTQTAEVNQFEVKAAFIEDCENYFVPGELPQQSDVVPEGMICTLRVEISKDGRLRRKVPFVIQHSACDESAEWKTVASAETGDGKDRGIAEVSFAFSSSEDHCRYRLLAPYNYRGFQTVSYPIETLAAGETGSR